MTSLIAGLRASGNGSAATIVPTRTSTLRKSSNEIFGSIGFGHTSSYLILVRPRSSRRRCRGAGDGAPPPKRGTNRHRSSNRFSAALAVRELPVERRHGAREPGIVVIDPHAVGARHHVDQSLRASAALQIRPPRPWPPASIQLAERSAISLSASAKRRVAARGSRERTDRLAMRLQHFDPAHQDVEQTLARRRFGEFSVEPLRQNLLVRARGERGQNFHRRAELAAQFDK